MKLIIDGNEQTIDLPSAPGELQIDRADVLDLVIALMLALQGKNYNETMAEIDKHRIQC